MHMDKSFRFDLTQSRVYFISYQMHCTVEDIRNCLRNVCRSSKHSTKAASQSSESNVADKSRRKTDKFVSLSLYFVSFWSFTRLCQSLTITCPVERTLPLKSYKSKYQVYIFVRNGLDILDFSSYSGVNVFYDLWFGAM